MTCRVAVAGAEYTIVPAIGVSAGAVAVVEVQKGLGEGVEGGVVVEGSLDELRGLGFCDGGASPSHTCRTSAGYRGTLEIFAGRDASCSGPCR